jgi:hypothetical protein
VLKALCLFLVFGAPRVLAGQIPQLSANEIMKRVAENQDREQKQRAGFVYEEDIRVATRRTNGKLAREESTSFVVLPTPTGSEKKRQTIHGRYWYKGAYLDFTGDPVPNADSLDGGLTSGFRDDLTNDNSKDGLGKNLFPLTTDEQKNYKFELAGEQIASGRKAFRIRFAPADSHDISWAGEALIDEEEFQPISVYTRLSRRLPLFVRTVLGTDLPGVGFNTQYARIDKDIWFPVSFGTEFRLHAVFFINRIITVSMESKNFKRASAESHIRYEDSPAQQAAP